MSTIGLGNALVDLLFQVQDDEALATVSINKGAMHMISEEQTGMIHKQFAHLKMSKVPGGSVCNSMRAYGMLGGRAGFYGKVGSDELGCYYEHALLSAGVRPYFSRAEGLSGCCTVLITPDGEKSMGTFLGPAPTLAPDDVREDILDLYDYIYVEGYMIVNEPLVRSTMEKAKRLGLKVALDLSNYNIVNSFREPFGKLIREYVDILFANEYELMSFVGFPVAEALGHVSKIVDLAVVTLGKKGAIIAKGAERIHIDAFGPPTPLDTTGAGDHFSAGFLYGISHGASIRQSGRVASLLAGHVINHIGPQIPDKEWKLVREQVAEILPSDSHLSK
ncbi:MAG: adenosine kinase [Tannerellaceae bacterium]|nr:adenosine kinase [Tannerellaceae bacterium]